MARKNESSPGSRGTRRLRALSLFTRSRSVGRCPVCGLEVSMGDDFVQLHGGAVHSECALYSAEGARRDGRGTGAKVTRDAAAGGTVSAGRALRSKAVVRPREVI